MNTDICERTELQELQDLYSDLHKDLYGCRPNTLISSNIEFLQERIADMSAEIQTYEDIERDAEERRFVLWEKRISEMMETHSISKARAPSLGTCKRKMSMGTLTSTVICKDFLILANLLFEKSSTKD